MFTTWTACLPKVSPQTTVAWRVRARWRLFLICFFELRASFNMSWRPTRAQPYSMLLAWFRYPYCKRTCTHTNRSSAVACTISRDMFNAPKCVCTRLHCLRHTWFIDVHSNTTCLHEGTGRLSRISSTATRACPCSRASTVRHARYHIVHWTKLRRTAQ